MTTYQRVLAFIDQVPKESLFTTRDLLNFGSRSAIDNIMSVMVRSGALERVARGVFHKSGRTNPVTALEVATTKAISFGRKLVLHAEDLAHKLGISYSPGKAGEQRFQTNGRTSAFKFLTTGQMIILDGTSQKKIAMGDEAAGQTIRALCQVGKENISVEKILCATDQLSHAQKWKATELCSSMPWWLSNQIATWFKANLERLESYRNSKRDGRVGERLETYATTAPVQQGVMLRCPLPQASV